MRHFPMLQKLRILHLQLKKCTSVLCMCRRIDQTAADGPGRRMAGGAAAAAQTPAVRRAAVIECRAPGLHPAARTLLHLENKI